MTSCWHPDLFENICVLLWIFMAFICMHESKFKQNRVNHGEWYS